MRWLASASAVALASLATPAVAQHQHMPGMTMPMPPKPVARKKPAAKKAAPKKEAAVKKSASKRVGTRKSVATNGAPAGHTDHSTDESMPAMDHGAMPMPSQPAPVGRAPMSMPIDHPQMDHSQMDHSQMAMRAGDHAGHGGMKAALGTYPATREASGTSWQPDTSAHQGLMSMSGDWMLMAHGVVNLVYDHQAGRRGDDKAFASGMLMGMAQRPFGNGTLQFRVMLSPDPLMGKRGYPLMLASGETANGTDRLIDRQHPHDLFMELSASVSQGIGRNSSLFLYAGLPGEPAFGPPAFMHREAILDSPEAPITHHWLDSTHISFGVVTGGIVVDRIKLEISRFNAREPDQHRWNIEAGPLDSTAVRVSWNPVRTFALQGGWGHFVAPEQLEPGIDQKRWSASALWADEVAQGWKMAGTLAWGRKAARGHRDDAIAVEASLKHRSWTLFGRGEATENRELTNLEDGPAYQVGKVSLGAVRDFRLADHLVLGAGGLVAINFVPEAVAPSYGGRNPTGAMGFLRLKLD